MKTINNAWQGEEKGIADNHKYSHLDSCILAKAKSAVNDSQDLQQKPQDKVSLEGRIGMLNADQSRVFFCVSDHLIHRHQHEIGTCKYADIHPLHMFVSGVGGTRKSFLIEAIQPQADAILSWQGSNSLVCVVKASTELAAFDVGGVTPHHLLQLPIEHESKGVGYWPL